ncbi:MAG: WYL domain-containing protein [Phormidium sp. BM_Day4_Bin.17]|nr:WYL domain-containing protein [Phormidium sp. BM_Day4_Bin.17]UCJ10585.1 MAG: WYL domain-containing protein [Phormidium sp. PBR-2020]
MTRKGQAITLSLQERDKRALEALALEFGKTWGDKPNISKLVQAIARRELAIAPNHDWSGDRIQALNQARLALIDRGDIATAVELARLLGDRSELSLPLRQEIETFLNSPSHPWRLQVEMYIRRQQSFTLSYQDATDRLWRFTICHAAIVRHEDREYLDCWCPDTQGNLDLPELRHNWCLRLDRIQDAVLSPTKNPWRKDFDRIPVEFYLYGRLAASYSQSKNHPEDIESDWLPEHPNIRRVVRSIYNTYWFRRELRRHGSDVEVMNPKPLRDLIAEDYRQMCDRYSNPPPS